jgi:hypothetical protein
VPHGVIDSMAGFVDALGRLLVRHFHQVWQRGDIDKVAVDGGPELIVSVLIDSEYSAWRFNHPVPQ